MFRVVLSAEGRTELRELRDYIAERESRRVASNYLRRLKSFIRTLAIAPHRGEHREGIRFDQKSIGFERRVSVIFEVDEVRQIVNIVGVSYAGRSLQQLER